jgi:hypothetical protein
MKMKAPFRNIERMARPNEKEKLELARYTIRSKSKNYKAWPNENKNNGSGPKERRNSIGPA